jgi:hypothetical protein
MLKPTKRDVTMHSIVEVTREQSSICLEVTYYIKREASNKPIIVNIEQLDEQSGRWEKKFNLSKNTDWAKKRVETSLPRAGKYKISITIVTHAAFIGDISFCKKREIYLALKIS